MEPINSINQKTKINNDVNVNWMNIGKATPVAIKIPYPDEKVESISKEQSLTYPKVSKGPVINSPKGFIDENEEVVNSLYNKKPNDNIFVSIFKYIKEIATKLGGWDKLIDLIMLLFPLPKHVKTILEILKKILPVLSPTGKQLAADFIFSALKYGDSTNSPEELLKKITESYPQTPEIKNEPAPTSDIPSYDSIIADKNLSLEDKIMFILLTLAEKQEKEILEQAKKLEKSSPESRERIQIELQIKVQKLQQTFQALSNLLKAFHETSINTIRNIR